MSDDTKGAAPPFAEVVVMATNQATGVSVWTVKVGGHFVMTGTPREPVEERAAAINAAHEAGLAKLREPLRAMLYALDDAYRLHVSGVFGDRATIDRMADAIRAGSAALGPNPPAYVPKAALDEALANVRIYQAALELTDMPPDERAQYSGDELREIVLSVLARAGLVAPEHDVDSVPVSIARKGARDALAATANALVRLGDRDGPGVVMAELRRLARREAAPPSAGARECSRYETGHIYESDRCACGAWMPVGVGHGAG